MNNVIACVFPDTLPDEDLIFPLVQVFDQLVYLQAVEDEPLRQRQASPFIERMLQQGKLHLFTPVPLGDQRERFLALTGDMQKRRDDYISQLSMLTLAGLSRRERMETKNSILTTLLQSGKIDSRSEEEEMLLWQSRLILKLGELFDTEQVELNEALQNITDRQDDLLAELREETDSPVSLTTHLNDSGHRADAILQHRLKAWSRLFFHGSPPPQPLVFITGHEAALNILQETFEKNHRQSAGQIARLELPTRRYQTPTGAPTSEPLVRQCPNLQTALAALATTDTLPPQMEAQTNLFAGCIPDWSQSLESLFPVAQHDRCTLELFLFPEISPRQLFLESFAGSSPAKEDKRQVTCSGTPIGLLTKK